MFIVPDTLTIFDVDPEGDPVIVVLAIAGSEAYLAVLSVTTANVIVESDIDPISST